MNDIQNKSLTGMNALSDWKHADIMIQDENENPDKRKEESKELCKVKSSTLR